MNPTHEHPVFRNNREPDPGVDYQPRDFRLVVKDAVSSPEFLIETNIQNYLVRYGGFPFAIPGTDTHFKPAGIPFRGIYQEQEGRKVFVRVYDDHAPVEDQFHVNPAPGAFFHKGGLPGNTYWAMGNGRLIIQFKVGVIPDKVWITAKEGLLWWGGKPIHVPEADRVAREYGFQYAEQLVRELERRQREC